MATSMLLLLVQITGTLGAIWVLRALFFSPLRHIPGPFLAKFTNLWRLLDVLGRHPEVTQRRLHDRYGPLVRLGPNMVSVSDPAMIPEIYSRKAILEKGDFYKVHDLNVHGHRVESIFSTRNEQLNSEIVRPVTQLYSMGAMIQLEPLIDKTIGAFLEHLRRRFVQPGRPCDMHHWLHYCAWDVIAEITFSQSMGFMAQGRDVLDMLATNHAALDYTSAVGMMPWLDLVLERNPLIRLGPPSQEPATRFCMERIAARRAGTDGHAGAVPDMLDAFIDAQEAVAEDKQDNALLAYVAANVIAGSDTVAAELRAILYYLCQNPEATKKLQAELDAADVPVPVPWSRCQGLPYLGACVAEGCRLLPGAALPLERRVGPGGLTMTDRQTVLPPRTLVGMNPAVVQRDRGVYGPDAHRFRPERWLRDDGETPDHHQARLRRMRAADLTFGAGKRICLGRNLALLEVHKIVASLVRTFDLALADPATAWTTHNAWLMRQTDIDVILKERRPGYPVAESRS